MRTLHTFGIPQQYVLENMQNRNNCHDFYIELYYDNIRKLSAIHSRQHIHCLQFYSLRYPQ